MVDLDSGAYGKYWKFAAFVAFVSLAYAVTLATRGYLLFVGVLVSWTVGGVVLAFPSTQKNWGIGAWLWMASVAASTVFLVLILIRLYSR